MPHLISPEFTRLVSSIPVRQHRVEVDRSFWRPLCGRPDLASLHDELFRGHDVVSISREWLHDADISPHLRCFAVLLWGYPSGVREARHVEWLARLPEIAAAAAQPAADWPDYYQRLHGIGGLGISTVTKLACFFGQRFGTDRLDALILDQRIIAVLEAGRWAELLPLRDIDYTSAVRSYPAYLKCLHDLASQTGTTGEQWEFFLFTLGRCF